MSNRRVEVLSKYVSSLVQLGFTKDDEKVKKALYEIEKELGIIISENVEKYTLKNPEKALVVAIKDVTGSIGLWENARFNEYYSLAMDRIKKKYKDVEQIFITHSTDANIVPEDEFFEIKGLGGTIVSSGLKKLIEVLGTDREVIVIQFSDGDNLTSDCERSLKLMNEEILTEVKYFKYVEANQYNRHSTLMTSAYKFITTNNFDYTIIKNNDDSLKGVRILEDINDKLNI